MSVTSGVPPRQPRNLLGEHFCEGCGRECGCHRPMENARRNKFKNQSIFVGILAKIIL